ncbi:MAG TPA: pilus assembly PilX N-terminal domain-containing protein [Candidatus Saccharimonadales bacterium]
MSDIHKKLDQTGIVSILICMIMMIVISLIAIGFIQLASSDHKSALNSQLNQEAYYAADSGINYATAAIQNDIAVGNSILSYNTCSSGLAYVGSHNTIDTGSSYYNVSYPCLTIDATPYNLPYLINSGQSKVVPVITSSVIHTITITWVNYQDPNPIYTGCPTNLPAFSSYNSCSASVLQIDLVDASSASYPTSATNIFYLYPTSHPGSTNISLASLPSGVKYVPCSSGSKCSVTLLMASFLSAKIYMKIMPVYGSVATSVDISAQNGPSDLALHDAQAQIVSTGKAQSVLQSIQSNIDISSLNSDSPGFAIQTQKSICEIQKVIGTTVNLANGACNGVE